VTHMASIDEAPQMLKAWSEIPAAFSKIMIALN
jgi:hypothetical protein